MVDEVTLRWAQAPSEYYVTSMRTADGAIAPHYLDEICQHGLDFDVLMEDPVFARIIDCELQAEVVASTALHSLANYAPSERVYDLFLRWLAFQNGDLQPWTTGGAIHFRPHWSRVLMLSLVIGEQRDLDDTSMEALAMAAVFHDSRRKNPYLDTGHGARAAEYYLQFCNETSSGALRRTPAGRAIRFDPRTYLAIRWHDRDDDTGLHAIAQVTSDACLPVAGIQNLRAYTPSDSTSAEDILRIFKDADALDRVRLGGMDHGGLDVRYLRTPEAHDLVDFANTLLHTIEPS
ncbi:MAG: hypothetical protein J5804_00285 [Eggerthellaceae bacterium]|nr:hypothetical protein [Eggerthellaceae bacterium]